MKARTRKTQATAQQRAWAANPRRHWISAGRLSNLAKRGLRHDIPWPRCIGTVDGFRFVTSPLLG